MDLASSKAYSRSSLDFRDIYVAIVLFLGAYVWIKFREVALRGVRKRVVKRGRITKVVYDARLTPPKWNSKAVPKLELGQFATEQEARDKFLIAAFYYNRDPGLLDGWFQVPPMSEEGRSLSGPEFGAWVKNQAKKVYEDFKKGKEEATFWQDLFKAWEDEMNVDFSIPRLLNADEHQELTPLTQLEDLEMDEAMVDNPGLECASQPFGRMGDGLALSNGHGPGFGEAFALPTLELSPNTESGVALNDRDQWDLLQTRVSTQQQQISRQQQQISLQQRQFDELVAQMLQLQSQLQKLQESRNQNPQ